MEVAAIVVSIVSLVVSSSTALRQAGLMHKANQVQVINSFLKEMRSGDFYVEEERLCDELTRRSAQILEDECVELNPNQGFSGLPENVKRRAYAVASYYLSLAYLVKVDGIDLGLAILPFKYRLGRTWEAIEPYVDAERTLRGDKESFLNSLEDFAKAVKGIPRQRSLGDRAWHTMRRRLD